MYLQPGATADISDVEVFNAAQVYVEALSTTFNVVDEVHLFCDDTGCVCDLSPCP